jgi:hypothetical protein
MSEMEEDVNVPISAEVLLAALLKTSGRFTIAVDDLLADYSEYQISVSQEEDGFVSFDLIGPDDEASE